MIPPTPTISHRLPEGRIAGHEQFAIRAATVRERLVDNPRPTGRSPTVAARSDHGFTLMELMVVIGIIVLLAVLTLPAVKSLTKSNDQSQSVNLVRSMIGTARAIAISQHRQAGVVFFEETSAYSSAPRQNQTAMQLFVEDYNQAQYGLAPGSPLTVFVLYSPAREYLPLGLKVATLSDLASATGNVQTGDSGSGSAAGTRAILFDANGRLVLRTGLSVQPSGNNTTPGSYPFAYGDWGFYVAGSGAGTATYNSSPGFFIYDKTEYDLQSDKIDWIKQHADVVVVNANTGTVLYGR